MTKRHQALVPLTQDHHRVLAHARRLKEAAAGDMKTLRRAADDFVNFHLGRGKRHLHEEEELFFAPLVDDDTIGSLVIRAVTEHLRLHAAVRTLTRQLSMGEVSGELLTRIADLLESHVRFEEQALFPLIEQNISEPELLALATKGRRDV